jgi:dUTPase
MKLKIELVHENAVIPYKATKGAAAYDLTCVEIIHESENYVRCKLGLKMEFDEGHRCILIPRSSITKYNWVLNNSPGLGDPDFRGEYEFRFRAIPTKVLVRKTWKFWKWRYELLYEPFPFKVGDRIGQIYFEKEIVPFIITTTTLTETDRIGGFGSTGV